MKPVLLDDHRHKGVKSALMTAMTAHETYSEVIVIGVVRDSEKVDLRIDMTEMNYYACIGTLMEAVRSIQDSCDVD